MFRFWALVFSFNIIFVHAIQLDLKTTVPMQPEAWKYCWRFLSGIEITNTDETFNSLPEAQTSCARKPNCQGVSYQANIALGRPTRMIDVGYGGAPERVVDGRLDVLYDAGTCSHTNKRPNNWWLVELANEVDIDYIRITNRGEAIGSRLNGAEVWVGRSGLQGGAAWSEQGLQRCPAFPNIGDGATAIIPCRLRGQHVVVRLPPDSYLTLCEVEVYPLYPEYRTGTGASIGNPSCHSWTRMYGCSADVVMTTIDSTKTFTLMDTYHSLLQAFDVNGAKHCNNLPLTSTENLRAQNCPGGHNRDYGQLITATFTLPGPTPFQVRAGSDWGRAGAIIIDGAIVNNYAGNFWWGGNRGNALYSPPGLVLGAGYHDVHFVGWEDCCDGVSGFEFTIDGSWNDFSLLSQEILSLPRRSNEGPAGPKGDAGPPGIQGLKGDNGPKGDTGLQGMKGDTGPQGLQGVKGDAGPAGNAGPQGPQGVVGPQGTAGPAGAAGAAGPMGIQGPAGAAGATGPAGPAGPVGPSGVMGPAGATGPSGAEGKQGAMGLIGPTGPAGPSGGKGDPGPIGATGPAGIQGIQGVQGARGDRGDTGATGAKGDIGPQGIQGIPGPIGPQGVTGPPGPVGDVVVQALSASQEKLEAFVDKVQAVEEALRKKVEEAMEEMKVLRKQNEYFESKITEVMALKATIVPAIHGHDDGGHNITPVVHHQSEEAEVQPEVQEVVVVEHECTLECGEAHNVVRTEKHHDEYVEPEIRSN